MALLVDNTPVLYYDLPACRVFVKREDLSCMSPGPSFSKVRGIAQFLQSHDYKAVGVLSTLVSKAGWGVAYCCQSMGIKCYNFVPKTQRTDLPMVENTAEALKLGAITVPVVNARLSILWARSKKILAEKEPQGIMLPNHLGLHETVEQTALEFCRTVISNGIKEIGTLVMPVGSGTICAGVMVGIARMSLSVREVIGVTATCDVSTARRLDSICSKAGMDDLGGFFSPVRRFEVVATTRKYLEPAPTDSIPFPCNPYYDAKAWEWLVQNQKQLHAPVYFWNIGA